MIRKDSVFSKTLVCSATVIASFLMLAFLPCIQADTVINLPYKLQDSSAIDADGTVYIFGGYTLTPQGGGMLLNNILSYSSTDSKITELSTKLPINITDARSFWDGTSAYIIAGVNQSGSPVSYLIKFTPPDKIQYYPHFFPYGLHGCSVVWTGRYAYVFGNCYCTGNATRNVIKFDTLSMNCTVIPSIIPCKLAGSSAIWIGNAAYIFGGRTLINNGDTILDTIYKFDPDANTLTLMKSKLPSPRCCPGVVLKDGKAYIFGGTNSTSYLDEILIYDPIADKISYFNEKLPYPLLTYAYANIGNKIMIFGAEKTGNPTDTVVTVDISGDQNGPLFSQVQAIIICSLTLIIIVVSIILISKYKKNVTMSNNTGFLKI